MVKKHSGQDGAEKMAYENPKMEIIRLQAADIITLSGEDGDSDNDGWTRYY